MDEFLAMINMIATQVKPREVYELFKRHFAPAAGRGYVGSTSEEWAATDLRDYMFDAAHNSPLFLSAFYDAVEALRSRSEFDLPTTEDINALCRSAGVGFEIEPPDLVPRHVVLSRTVSEVMKAATTVVAALAAEYREDESDEHTFDLPEQFDVAITVAGPDRKHAKRLAERLTESNLVVFYDELYPEHLWGRDLVDTFDEIFRLKARFCAMFVSQAYAAREWTNHERRSALARAVKEKGASYILPIRLDDTDLLGLPNSVSYMSLSQYSIDEIAQFLVKKVRAAKRRGA